MMGIKARAFGPLPPVSLEDLIPPDHVSRQLERSLDLGFVRDLVKGTDANLGRPSIDPVVCFKRPLVLFFEGLRSERQRLRVVADRLRRRWQLGDDLTESLPDHSSLTRLRERSGLEVFRRFFAAIVEQCLAAGLVWGRELDIDATDVAANAAYDSLRPRFAAEAHLARLFPESTTSAAAEDDGPEESGNAEEGAAEHPRPTPLPRALPAAAQAALAAAAAERHDGIGETGHPDRNRASGPSRRVADFWASLTDPDASPLRPTGGAPELVLATLVTPAAVQDNQPALDVLWRARFRWKLHPRQITGDRTDGTAENIVAIEDQHIRASVPLSAAGRRPGLFADTDFVFNAQNDTYRCPGNETLRFISRCERTQRRVDEAPAAACQTCVLKAQCTTSRRGRRVGRGFDEDDRDRVRGYHATEPDAKAMRKRHDWVEPRFAEAKEWHGLRRFRLRGLEQVNGEALLIAAGQNLKRLLRRWGWGGRPFPSGAAGSALPALPPLPAPTR